MKFFPSPSPKTLCTLRSLWTATTYALVWCTIENLSWISLAVSPRGEEVLRTATVLTTHLACKSFHACVGIFLFANNLLATQCCMSGLKLNFLS